MQEDNYTRIDKNGMSEAQQYEFSPNPEGGTVVLTKRKNGRWVRQGESMKHGTAFAIGYRSRYYDYSF
ncbi:MAG: hypothetical protein E6R03_14640 [Hyphomicrobiaceae bacterium]|nr:MAG: hypothetical protein E6R03_14640 [Hyphomicrobiaceae bacterium]